MKRRWELIKFFVPEFYYWAKENIKYLIPRKKRK